MPVSAHHLLWAQWPELGEGFLDLSFAHVNQLLSARTPTLYSRCTNMADFFPLPHTHCIKIPWPCCPNLNCRSSCFLQLFREWCCGKPLTSVAILHTPLS